MKGLAGLAGLASASPGSAFAAVVLSLLTWGMWHPPGTEPSLEPFLGADA